MSPRLKRSLILFLETCAPCMDILYVVLPERIVLNSKSIKQWQEREDCCKWEAVIGKDNEEGERNRRYLRLTYKKDHQTGYMDMWCITSF